MKRLLSAFTILTLISSHAFAWGTLSPSASLPQYVRTFLSARDQDQIQLAAEELSDIVVKLNRAGFADREILRAIQTHVSSSQIDRTQLMNRIQVLEDALQFRFARENKARSRYWSVGLAASVVAGLLGGVLTPTPSPFIREGKIVPLAYTLNFAITSVLGYLMYRSYPDWVKTKIKSDMIDALRTSLNGAAAHQL